MKEASSWGWPEEPEILCAASTVCQRLIQRSNAVLRLKQERQAETNCLNINDSIFSPLVLQDSPCTGKMNPERIVLASINQPFKGD